MKIGILAKQTETPASTLRYYEKIGLLPIADRQSGQRIYDQSSVQLVKFINTAKATGFSLDEIIMVLQTPKDKHWRSIVEAKIVELDVVIQKHKEMKEKLLETLKNECVNETLETLHDN